MDNIFAAISIRCDLIGGQLLFVDMDDTLIDTNFANFLSYQKAVSEVFPNEESLIFNSADRFNRSTLSQWIPEISIEKYSQVIKLKNQYYADHLNETKVNVDVLKVIDHFSQEGVALVTNSRAHRTLMTLKHHNLTDRFNYIFCGPDDVKVANNKYVAALEKLNAEPTVVLVLENDRADIRLAEIAGIPSENIFSIF